MLIASEAPVVCIIRLTAKTNLGFDNGLNILAIRTLMPSVKLLRNGFNVALTSLAGSVWRVTVENQITITLSLRHLRQAKVCPATVDQQQ